MSNSAEDSEYTEAGIVALGWLKGTPPGTR